MTEFIKTSSLSVLLSLTLFAQPALTATPACAAPQEREILQNYHRADKHFKRGLDEFRDGKFDKAKASFQQALNQMPQFAEAALYLGITLYKLKDHEASLASIQSSKDKYMSWFALRQQIDIERYYQVQSQIQGLQDRISQLEAQQQQQQQQQQRQQQQQGGSSGSSNSHAVENLRRQIDKLRQTKLPTVTEPVIPGIYYFHCGNTLMAMNKCNEAFIEYQQAVKVEPKYGDAHHNLAIIYYMAKQYENAWNHLELAREYGGKINPQFEATLKKQLGQ